jgi:hypothetical protein
VIGFTRDNVSEFFNLLESVLDEQHLDGSKIYNMDGFSLVPLQVEA